jgi:SAM-dependent methyltransferase
LVTADATKYWSEPRSREAYERYWAAAAQPHRHVLVGALHLIPRFTSLLEVGCFVGTNLRLIRDAFPWVELEGSDLNAGAVAFAKAHIPGVTFRCSDVLTEAASWLPRSIDVIVSCYALAYVSPTDLPGVLTNAVAAARCALVIVEPYGDGLVPGFDFPEWRHDYARILMAILSTTGRKAQIDRSKLAVPVDRCDGRVVVTFTGD